MDDFLENMPVWYENLLSDSLSLAPRSHDVLEAVVGIGGLVFQGKEDEAFRLGNLLRQQRKTSENMVLPADLLLPSINLILKMYLPLNLLSK